MVEKAIKRMVESLKNPIFNIGFCNFEYNEFSDNHYFKTGERGQYSIKLKKQYNINFLKELYNSFKNNQKKDSYYIDLIIKVSDIKHLFNYQCGGNFTKFKEYFNFLICKELQKNIDLQENKN